METLILDVPVFSGKIISPIWIKAVRDFQSKSKTERDSYCLNCIIQLSVNPKDPSESFFGVYDRDNMKLIYGIKTSILKGMFCI